ncbi:tetratricopeptide repeat protein, partial [Gemmatimonadota bacterium]
ELALQFDDLDSGSSWNLRLPLTEEELGGTRDRMVGEVLVSLGSEDSPFLSLHRLPPSPAAASPWARFVWARLLYREGGYEQALNALDEITDVDPDVALAWAWKARAFSRLSWYLRGDSALALDDSALRAGIRAYNLNSESPLVLGALADALSEQGYLHEAGSLYFRGLRTGADFSHLYNNGALLAGDVGCFDAANVLIEGRHHREPGTARPYWLDDVVQHLLSMELDDSASIVNAAADVQGYDGFDFNIEVLQGKADSLMAEGVTWWSVVLHARRYDSLQISLESLDTLNPAYVRVRSQSARVELWDVQAASALLLSELSTATDRRKAEEILEMAEENLLSSNRHDPWIWYNVALTQSVLGLEEDALESLGRAYDLGFREPRRAKVNPLLDNIRDTPRFQGIVALMEEDVRLMRERYLAWPPNAAETHLMDVLESCQILNSPEVARRVDSIVAAWEGR